MRLLIIEDDELDARAMRRLVARRFGPAVDVQIVADHADGIAAVRGSNPPDAVVVDYSEGFAPGGVDVARECHTYGRTACLVYSGADVPRAEDRAILGALGVEFAPKGARFERILDWIGTVSQPEQPPAVAAAPGPAPGRGLASALGTALAGDWPGKGLVLAALVAGATVFGVRWVDAGAAPDEAAMAAVAKQLDAVEAKLDKVVEHLAEASLTRREADRIERILDRATRRPEAGR